MNIQNSDNLLINKTLVELLNKKDVFYNRAKGNGQIVIINKSLIIDPENKRLTNKRPIKKVCRFTENQKASFKLNNKKSINLKSVVKESNLYRFIKKDESNSIGSNILSGEVKSYISISKPGYSVDKTAIVIVSYTWSIHGALAKFIYSKTQDSWELKCSEYIIHP